ncbi:hypothetical protein IC582_022677 [Cucumis melo]
MMFSFFFLNQKQEKYKEETRDSPNTFEAVGCLFWCSLPPFILKHLVCTILD